MINEKADATDKVEAEVIKADCPAVETNDNEDPAHPVRAPKTAFSEGEAVHYNGNEAKVVGIEGENGAEPSYKLAFLTVESVKEAAISKK